MQFIPKKYIELNPKTQAIFLVRQGWPKANECETSGDGEWETAQVQDERFGTKDSFGEKKTQRA